jgi:hypothetical protein
VAQQKTRQQLEAECQATIKLVLTEMEALAVLPPETAFPYEYETRRRSVVRKIWNLFKECITYEPPPVQ